MGGVRAPEALWGRDSIPTVGLAGKEGPALVRLLAGLVRALALRGLRVAVVHAGEPVPWGDERKDTGRFRQAGAAVTALAAPGLLEVTRAAPASGAPADVLPLLGPEVEAVLVVGPAALRSPHILVTAGGCAGGLAGETGLRLAEVAEDPAPGPTPRFPPQDVEALGEYLVKLIRGET